MAHHVYSRSCSFCHGEKGDGKGIEARRLTIPPEDISAIRTTGRNLDAILAGGVSGSAMPYFTVFDRYKLDSLIDYLDKNYSVVRLPEPLPVKISDALLLFTIFLANEAVKFFDGLNLIKSLLNLLCRDWIELLGQGSLFTAADMNRVMYILGRDLAPVADQMDVADVGIEDQGFLDDDAYHLQGDIFSEPDNTVGLCILNANVLREGDRLLLPLSMNIA